MTPILTIMLLVLAFVLFVLAAIGVPTRYNLIAGGLAAWVLVQILALALK